MLLAHDVAELSDLITDTTVTIGNFDGVHEGHRALINTAFVRAHDEGHIAVVVTFDPHPLAVLTPGKHPPFITPTRQKLEIIDEIGPEICLLLPFTSELAATPPRTFLHDTLVKGLSMKRLVVGYDWSFGRDRAGTRDILEALAVEEGFELERLHPVKVAGRTVSSSLVRQLVSAGQVHRVKPYLGRFYCMWGRVTQGEARGRLLGYPTANLQPNPDDHELIPGEGVYAAWVRVLDAPGISPCRPYAAMANIGRLPTFGADNPLSIEAHVFDFSGDLYGHEVALHFVRRLRSERRFDGPDELAAQLAKDEDEARITLALPPSQLQMRLPGGDARDCRDVIL